MRSDLLVSGYGRVNFVRLADNAARFTLQSGKNRFFVTAAGAEQCRVVQEASDSGNRLFVVGRLFSFVHSKCAQHHVGIEAEMILPTSSTPTEQAMIGLIEQQILSNQMRNGNGNGNGKIAIVA